MQSTSTSKWLNAGGALIALMAFFLPFFSIEITGFFGFGISLALIASAGGQAILYFVPLGLIAILVLSFMPAGDPDKARSLVIGQLVAWLVSVLCIGFVIMSIYSQMNQGLQFLEGISAFTDQDLGGMGVLDEALSYFSLTPGAGLFLFVIGNILLIIGLVMAWNEVGEDYLPEGDLGETVTVEYPEGGRVREYAQPRKPRKKVQAWLVAKDGRDFQLNQGTTTIGRLAENDIRLSDPKIGRRHVKIIEQKGHFRLVDLASKNGTWVNGKLVRGPVLLHPNDQIRFGDSYKVQFIAPNR